MTPAESRKLVAMIAARYPVPAIPRETIELWAELVVDLECAVAKAAAMEWFRSREERLDPAQLRRLVAQRQARADVPYLDPDQAWAHVEWALIHIGSYDRFPATHPLVAEIVNAMGWHRLCRTDNGVADRAHFLQLYRARLERAKAEDAARPGARPIAAMGEQRQVPPQRQQPAQLEDQRATRADAQSLVRTVMQSMGSCALPPPQQVVDAAESPTIGDEALVAAREERRRTMLADLAERNGGLTR